MAARAKTKAKGRTAAKSAVPVKKKRKTLPSTEFSVYAPDAKKIF